MAEPRDIRAEDLIRALPEADRIALTRLKSGPGVRAAALHFAVIAGLAVAIGTRVPGWPILMLPQGIALIFLFTLHHEVVHRTVFTSARANDAVARVCGVLIGLPSTWFRYFHLAHHRHTQDPERDPELAHQKPETPAAWAFHVTGLPVWWGQVQTLVRNAAGKADDPFLPTRAATRIRAEARAMLALYGLVALISIAVGSALALWVWIVPVLLGQPFLRLYLLAEHGRCPFVANMLHNTRTTYTNRLVRALAWNMPFHAEHHAAPQVPFHQLPALNKVLRDHIAVTSPGYVAFNLEYLDSL